MPPPIPQAQSRPRPTKETPIPPPSYPRMGATQSLQTSTQAPIRSPIRHPVHPSSHSLSSPTSADSRPGFGSSPSHNQKREGVARPPSQSSLNSKQVGFGPLPNLENVPSEVRPPSTPGRGSRIEVVLDRTPRATASLAQPPRIGSEDLEDDLIVSDITPRDHRQHPSNLPPVAAGTPALPVPKPLPDQSSALAGSETEPPKKKRGRPKGWKPGMPYSSSGAPSPAKPLLKRADRRDGSNAPNYVLKKRRRGRPTRPPSPTPQEIFEKLRPRYVPYLCEWKGCPAELHNMETLRRHVHAVHCRRTGSRLLSSPSPLACKWAKCGLATPCPTFGSQDELRRHVEERHLVPFAWHLGDGYRNSTEPIETTEASDEVPAYLLDEEGNQVTPWVKGQEIEDFITWRNNRRRLRELLLQRDANAPYEDDDSA